MSKETQKKLLIEIMEADEKDGLYKTNNMAQQTYGEWMRSNPPIPKLTVIEWFLNSIPQRFKNSLINECSDEIEQAKQTEKEQMVKFAEFVSSHPDKNKNYLGEMLHAKSKYDEAVRTIDLLEQYYNETYGKSNS